jgi:hypothetical protein
MMELIELLAALAVIFAAAAVMQWLKPELAAPPKDESELEWWEIR